MFSLKFKGPLSLPQLDRIRWHMFPEVRIAASSSGSLFADIPDNEEIAIPDLLRVMDLQQEQLARSLRASEGASKLGRASQQHIVREVRPPSLRASEGVSKLDRASQQHIVREVRPPACGPRKGCPSWTVR